MLSESVPLTVLLKARLFKLMCKALVHDNSTLTCVSKLACRNPVCEWKELA